mmetsp:Transcript_4105/g.4683  ORF Transcript_4105/g.4683 Transcript_4105/m.4683 type:complete len:83 (-) Transcript_4105:1696-1944(-)
MQLLIKRNGHILSNTIIIYEPVDLSANSAGKSICPAQGAKPKREENLLQMLFFTRLRGTKSTKSLRNPQSSGNPSANYYYQI